MGYKRKDAYYKRAKREQFAARSVYKLEEIDRRFKLLKAKGRVLDLGCSPGSWMQYAAEVVGPNGFVLGYDLEPPMVNAGQHCVTKVADVHELLPERILADVAEAGQPGGESFRFDAVLSDMMPKTTGIRDADQARSIGVVEAAKAIADSLLGPKGVFVAKVFQGRGFEELLRELRAEYTDVRVLKPDATRKGSRESFFIAKGRKA